MVVDGESGITVLEVMIVLVILSLVAVVGTIQISQLMDRAKADVAKLQLQQVSTSLEVFRLDLRRYPTADEGLGVLLTAPQDEAGWRGPYLKGTDLMVDPWGEPVRYAPIGDAAFSLTSLGSDRKEGGEGAAQDIVIGSAG
jgi:general secretion pathway protein G